MKPGTYIRTSEIRKKQSESLKIAMNRPETKAKRSVMLRIVMNKPEVRAKQSLAQSGKKRPHSEETKRKIALAHTGRKRILTPEWKEKIGLANRGKKRPPRSREWCEKLTAARRRNFFIHRPPSKSSVAFLDEIERMFGVEIEREYPLKRRFFDGRWNNYLIEVDGAYWHKNNQQIDELKNKIAAARGFILRRFEVNNLREVKMRLQHYHDELENIFRVAA